MKTKSKQSIAHEIRKSLTHESPSDKKLLAEVADGKFLHNEFVRRSIAKETKPVKTGFPKFLCNKLSLSVILRAAETMSLDDAENVANRKQAITVKNDIESALTSNTVEHAAKMAFIAGLRWMEIFWRKSLKAPGGDRRPEWDEIEKVIALFPHKKQIEQIRIGLERYEAKTGKKSNRPAESFQKVLLQRLK